MAYVVKETVAAIVAEAALDRIAHFLGIEKTSMVAHVGEYVLFALVAGACVYGAFWIGRYDRPSPLQLLYGIDPTFVRHRRGLHGNVSHTWFYIGVRNGSADKTLEDVTIWALRSPFAEHVIGPTHARERIDRGRHRGDVQIRAIDGLNPHVTEYFQLVGVPPDFGVNLGSDDVLNRPQQFVIEARAKDAKAARIVLEFDPRKNPVINGPL